ncbi:hypothetical protein DVH05_007524 [Phytophthora capsici]|nr:hypothetical protein DVH05_007524 [Phytophthora capsici]
MRLPHFLLVATATFLSSYNSTATVSTEGQMMPSADAAVPVRALEANDGKRFLRYYKKEDMYDENDGDDDVDDDDKYDEEVEERGVMTATQVAKWTDKANKWVRLKETLVTIKEKLTNMKGVISAKNREKYNLFTAVYGRANPHVFERL